MLMESTKGYVYIMINPSYKDLVKIGKTTKEPELRANELSSPTGVATPFIVVYKRLFNNCDKAERLVHSILTEQGYRVNNSREFFSISIPDAIDIILGIPDDEECYNSDKEFTYTDIEDENIADIYYSQAEDYYYGYNDTFEDVDKAFDLYKKSSELGKKEAWFQLGHISYYTRENIKEALKYFHEGAINGDYLCFAELGKIYINKNEIAYNRRNADLAWTKFFEFMDTHQEEWETYAYMIEDYLATFVYNSFLYDEQIIPQHEEYIHKYIKFTHKGVIALIERFKQWELDYSVDILKEKVIPYIESLEKKSLNSYEYYYGI